MQTTSILAELLVIGCTALLWVIPILQKVTDGFCCDFLLSSKEIVISLALTYLLGILMNYVSDRLFNYFEKKYAKENGGNEIIKKFRSKILLSSSSATTYMNTRRSIVRIMRASSCNFLIYAVIIALSVTNPFKQLPKMISFTVVLGTCILFLLGYIHTLIGYYKFLILTGEMIND